MLTSQAQAGPSPGGQAKTVPVQGLSTHAANRTFKGRLVSRWNATSNEAGRPEGRVVRALVLGEQRYPDPTVWGPKTKKPLMQDEKYRETLAFRARLDEQRERD